MAKWDHDDLRNLADNQVFNISPTRGPLVAALEPPLTAREELELRAGSLAGLIKPAPVLGTQVGGDHYTRQKIQPISYIWANGLGFSEGNIVKYVTRWKFKGGVKDLKKAHHHLALLIEEAERAEREDGAVYGLRS